MSNMVFINWSAVELQLGRVIDQAELVAKSGLNARTVAKSLNKGESLRRKKADILLRSIGIKTPADFLGTDNNWESKATSLAGSFLADWKISDEEVAVEKIRDLSYRVVKATHSETGRVGRAKIFHLKKYDDETLEFVKKELRRNPEICALIERDGRFPLLYDCGPVSDDRYWSIERWEDAKSLRSLVKSGELDKSKIPWIANELAKALHTLNEVGVVYRCLTPKNVCLRNDGSLFVRDFELSTFAGLTKSRDLDEDRIVFYSPEYESPDVDFRADMYSWAQIVIFCLTGRQPPSNCDRKFLATLEISDKNTFAALESCCDRNPNFRSLATKSSDGKSNFADLIAQTSGWEAKSNV